MAISKTARRRRIHHRITKKVKGTSQRPRLAVYRSNKAIYCQLIDDVAGVTLLAADSSEIGEAPNKTEQAKEVGKAIALKAKSNNIETIVFDRGGYLYHGRVKALADGARENGLKF